MPIGAFATPAAWTYSVQSETKYNREAEKWAMPLNAAVSKLVRIGKLPVSLLVGVGYWLGSPVTDPEGSRLRLQASFVLPK